MARPVDELVREDDVGRRVLLFHRADGARRKNRVDAEELEAEDIGAIVQLARRETMAASVAREEGHAHAVDLADDVDVGRIAEGSLDLALVEDGQPFHLVQAGAADDPYCCVVHCVLRDIPNRFNESSMAFATRMASSTAARPSSPLTSGRVPVVTHSRNASSSARSGSFFVTFKSMGTIDLPSRRKPFTSCSFVSMEM